MKDKKAYHTFTYAGLFAVAMGLLEAIVVVYLRKLYYPQGFDFPLQPMSSDILTAEIVREACTMVMLAAVALMAGKNKLQKFAWFIYCFAVWDIFYYIGLKIFLNWPPSLFTWDLLFLIPMPWVGPVITPVICSLTMILLAACIVVFQARGYDFRIIRHEWVLIFAGAFIIFVSFIWDFSRIIMQGRYHPQVMAQYQPVSFVWPVFILGELLILAAVAMMVIRTRSSSIPA
jgi:hypothetical protein